MSRPEPLFLYGNWSAYDELSDGVPLTEELAMRQMSELDRLRSAGVRFDGYLMDAFWFAKDGAYRTWRKLEWPSGPDAWIEACHARNLFPGLWFMANTVLELDVAPSWKDSIDAKNWGLCLFEGRFLEDYLDVLDYWYVRGIRVFKFDFAEFGAVPAGREAEFDQAEVRLQNVSAFRKAMKMFRSGHPEAILLGYNGFEERECMERTDRPAGRYIDPAWLETFDSLYCGDPRPSDLPCGSFWRSVDIYSDCMTRLFESSGIPLDRIDNCGFMAGPTGTCYWRGKLDWKAMLLLSLARGGSVQVAYGDLALFNQEDAHWWAAAQRLYLPAMRAGRTRSFGGWPGSGETYGWLSSADGYEVATVVNPSLQPRRLKLPDGEWKLMSHDPGFSPLLRESGLELGAGQIAVLVAGKSSADELTLDEDVGVEQTLRPVRPYGSEEGGNKCAVDFGSPLSGRFRIVTTQKAANGDVLRTYPGEGNRYPISIAAFDGKSTLHAPRMIDGKIWSGLSWTVWDATFNEVTLIEASSVEKGACVELDVYRIGPDLNG